MENGCAGLKGDAVYYRCLFGESKGETQYTALAEAATVLGCPGLAEIEGAVCIYVRQDSEILELGLDVVANLLLVCDAIAGAFTYPLPISTVSALFGAPIVIYVILKK